MGEHDRPGEAHCHTSGDSPSPSDQQTFCNNNDDAPRGDCSFPSLHSSLFSHDIAGEGGLGRKQGTLPRPPPKEERGESLRQKKVSLEADDDDEAEEAGGGSVESRKKDAVVEEGARRGAAGGVLPRERRGKQIEKRERPGVWE